jgi:hypothetical protein
MKSPEVKVRKYILPCCSFSSFLPINRLVSHMIQALLNITCSQSAIRGHIIITILLHTEMITGLLKKLPAKQI